MKQFLAGLFLVACLPACTALNCYVCASGMTGCNDPFNSTAYNVTMLSLGTNIYCVKAMLTSSIVTRYGAPTCTDIPFLISSLGMACCQTDLCNGAAGTTQILLSIVLGFFLILFKFH